MMLHYSCLYNLQEQDSSMSTYWYSCCTIVWLLFVSHLTLLACGEEKRRGTRPFHPTRAFCPAWSCSFFLSFKGCISPEFEPFLPRGSVFPELIRCITFKEELSSENKGITQKRYECLTWRRLLENARMLPVVMAKGNLPIPAYTWGGRTRPWFVWEQSSPV